MTAHPPLAPTKPHLPATGGEPPQSPPPTPLLNGVWGGVGYARKGPGQVHSEDSHPPLGGTNMTPNLKPADELLSLRQRIKEMQAREAEIREGMLAGELELHGDFAIVEIKERKTSRFDKKAAEAELGDLSRFEVKGKQFVLNVSELEEVIE